VSVTLSFHTLVDVVMGICLIAFGLMFTKRRPMKVPVGAVLGIIILWIAIHGVLLILRTDEDDTAPLTPFVVVIPFIYLLRKSLGDGMVVNVAPEDVERALVDALTAKRMAFTHVPRRLTVPSMGGYIEVMYLAYAGQVNLMIKTKGDKSTMKEVIDVAIGRLRNIPSRVTPLFGLYWVVFGIVVIAVGFLY